MSLIGNVIYSLSTCQVWLSIVFAALAWYYVSTYRTRRLLAKLPGPRGWPLIGNVNLFWGSKESVRVTSYRVLTQLSKSFASKGIVRLTLGPKDIVLLTSPDTVETLLKCQVNIAKGPLYKLSECVFGQGLATSGGNKWRNDRKLLTPAFHFEILDNFNPVLNRHAAILVKRLKATPRVSNLLEKMSTCTFDAILETAMGIRCNVQSYSSEQFLSDQDRFLGLTTERVLNLLYHSDRVYAMTSNGEELNAAVARMLKFTLSVISTRKAEKLAQIANGHVSPSTTDRKALLDIVLDIHLNESTKHLMSIQNIQDQIVTFIIAGNDTVGTTVQFALYNLAKDSVAQHTIQTEIDQLFPESGSDLNISAEHFRQMPFTEAVIKETLRLAPPAPILPRLLVQDLEVTGYTIPKGTEVWTFVPGVHRREELYVNADKFVPERWLTGNESMRSVKAFSFIAFSGGPRNCIGQRFAMNEMKILMGYLIKNFTVELIDEEEPVFQFGQALSTTKPIRVVFKSRS